MYVHVYVNAGTETQSADEDHVMWMKLEFRLFCLQSQG